MLKFWRGIICILLHRPKKHTLLNLLFFDLMNTRIREFVNLWIRELVNPWLSYFVFHNTKYMQVEHNSWICDFMILWIHDFVNLGTAYLNFFLELILLQVIHMPYTKYQIQVELTNIHGFVNSWFCDCVNSWIRNFVK